MSNRSAEIVGASAHLYRIENAEPHGDAIQQFDALELPFVRLRDRGGVEGTGFGYTIGRGGSTIVTLIREELLPALEGADSRNIRRLHRRLRDSIHALCPGPVSSVALSAIDVALWDLAARRHGVPLHVLLGGAQDRVRVYDTDVGWLNRPLDEALELASAAEKRGFRAFKLKVGKPDPEEDEERVGKFRERFGASFDLMADANQSWRLDEAVPRLRRLARYDLAWIEEPLEATDLQGYAELARHVSIPRAGGESLYDASSFYECARGACLDIFQPDVARLGGITPALDVCALGACCGRPVAPHVSPELSLVVAAAVPNAFYIEYIPQMEPVLRRRLEIEDGCALAGTRPGHGIEFDEDALSRVEVRVA